MGGMTLTEKEDLWAVVLNLGSRVAGGGCDTDEDTDETYRIAGNF